MAHGPTRRRTARILRVTAGVAIWATAIAALWPLLQGEDARGHETLAHTRAWLLDRAIPVRITTPKAVEVEIGDPVFFGSLEGGMTLVGEVDALVIDGRPTEYWGGMVREFRVSVRPGDRSGLNSSSRATYISVPQTAAWVMKTLLPDDRLAWIAREWNDTLVDHREEIFEAINPILQDLVTDAERLLTSDLPDAFDRHRDKIVESFGAVQSEVVGKEFLPLLRDELFPLLLRRARPTLDAIGEEVLAKLPVWSLTWRVFYEKLPLTAEGHVMKAWNGFVDEEVVPILRSHIEDAIGALGDVAGETARNPRVAGALRRSVRAIVTNREIQHEVRLIFQEIILDNPNFHDAMSRRWRSPEMRTAIEKLSRFVAPLLTRIGEQILGTRRDGITPEFARVLRTQILQKDRRWILLEAGPADAPALEAGAALTATIQQSDG